jgi:integrase/recombinase XerD
MDNKFKEYLEKQGLKKQTAVNYLGKLKQLLKRAEEVGKNIDTMSLDELYQFKNQYKEEGFALATIKQHFVSLKYYYGFIGRKDNPAVKMKFEKRQQTLPTNQLTLHEMLDLYRSYPVYTIKDKRDIVILGVMIFQGLKRAEVEQLELHHIDTSEGTIYIPSTSQTNSRTIKLEAIQMECLLDYIYDIREKLLQEKKKETNRLFFSLGTGTKMDNVLQHSLQILRTKNKYFKSFTQLRESRISLWITENGIRKTQYLSGMKYASSLERYQTKDIEQLRQKLSIAHPMERI